MTDYYTKQADCQDVLLLGGSWSYDSHAGQLSTRVGPRPWHAPRPFMVVGVGGGFKLQAPAPRPEPVACKCSKTEPTLWGAIVDFVLFLIFLQVCLYVLGY